VLSFLRILHTKNDKNPMVFEVVDVNQRLL